MLSSSFIRVSIWTDVAGIVRNRVMQANGKALVMWNEDQHLSRLTFHSLLLACS